MSDTAFIVNGVDVLEENAKLKKENEILQTSLEMIKNTEGQAHIKAIELTKKLEKIKEKCKFFISKCNECENPDTTIDCIDCTTGGKAIASYKILNIIEDIEGAEDE